MVEKDFIVKSIDEALNKCTDYPKANALRNYNPEDYPNDTDSSFEAWSKQNEEQLKVEYERWDKNRVHYYGKNTYHVINSMLWDNDDWKRGVERGIYDDQEYYDEFVEGLDKVIEKSPPIQVPTTVYRGGRFPQGMKIGDHGVLKGYTSTSYNPNTARGFKATDEDRYLITIRVAKGTKGVLFNEQFETFTESELLVGRNQKYVVLNVNDDAKEVEILLYD